MPVDRLIPYARNAKLHSEEQVAKIAASIREFGFNNPVLIDKDCGIIAGHGRVIAARRIGMKEIPCIRLGHLTEAQKRAYIIADNRLAEIGGGWDEHLLSAELGTLVDLGYDACLTGFDDDEIEKLLAEDDVLNEKTEQLVPVKWTRILISLSGAINADEITEIIKRLAELGAEVDYDGN